MLFVISYGSYEMGQLNDQVTTKVIDHDLAGSILIWRIDIA